MTDGMNQDEISGNAPKVARKRSASKPAATTAGEVAAKPKIKRSSAAALSADSAKPARKPRASRAVSADVAKLMAVEAAATASAEAEVAAAPDRAESGDEYAVSVDPYSNPSDELLREIADGFEDARRIPAADAPTGRHSHRRAKALAVAAGGAALLLTAAAGLVRRRR
jgi:hypothetical protein